MAIRVSVICLLGSFMLVAIAADLTPERYWSTALPNTPIPNSLHNLLTQDFTDEKSTNVQVGEEGVNVNVGKAKPGGGALNVGKGGARVKYRGGARLSIKVVYHHAATETQLHYDPNEALFFLEKDLVPQKAMNVRFDAEDGYDGKTVFLPRREAESIPFGSEKFAETLSRLSVKPGSEEAKMMKMTIEECEAKKVGGEEKNCATSFEAMVDFSVSKLGKYHVRAISTEVSKNAPLQKYKIAAAGVRKLSDDNSVVCHKQTYPFAVFYCHKLMMTSVYAVPLEGENGTRAKAVAVCHKDTSAWNPNHLALKLLKVKPGMVPVCHFLSETDVVWFNY